MEEILDSNLKITSSLRNCIDKENYQYSQKKISYTSFTQIKNSVFSRTLKDCFLVSSLLKEMYNETY